MSVADQDGLRPGRRRRGKELAPLIGADHAGFINHDDIEEMEKQNDYEYTMEKNEDERAKGKEGKSSGRR